MSKVPKFLRLKDPKELLLGPGTRVRTVAKINEWLDLPRSSSRSKVRQHARWSVEARRASDSEVA